jgi:transposase, IS6 family
MMKERGLSVSHTTILRKKIVKPMIGFQSYKSACVTLSGIKVMHMIHKGQAGKPDVLSEIKLINRLFGVA